MGDIDDMRLEDELWPNWDQWTPNDVIYRLASKPKSFRERFVWTTKEGKTIRLPDITDVHLQNIINYLRHKMDIVPSKAGDFDAVRHLLIEEQEYRIKHHIKVASLPTIKSVVKGN